MQQQKADEAVASTAMTIPGCCQRTGFKDCSALSGKKNQVCMLLVATQDTFHANVMLDGTAVYLQQCLKKPS